jgi:hypothetical protein
MIEIVITALVVVFLGGASLAGIIYIWMRAAQRPVASAGIASCGSCSYPVFAIQSLSCPECGADFTQVGITAPGMRKRCISPVPFVILWMLCLILPACMISGLLVYIGPQKTYNEEDCTIQPVNQSVSNFDSIMISRSHIGAYTSEWEDEYMLGHHDFLMIDIYGLNDENDWFEVDLNNMTYSDLSTSGAQGVPLTREHVERWLGMVGADLKQPAVQAQADELYDLIQRTPEQGLGDGSSPSFTSISQSHWPTQVPHLGFVLIQPVIWFLIFMSGIVIYIFLYLRYQRLERQMTLDVLKKQEKREQEQPPDPAGSPQPQ